LAKVNRGGETVTSPPILVRAASAARKRSSSASTTTPAKAATAAVSRIQPLRATSHSHRSSPSRVSDLTQWAGLSERKAKSTGPPWHATQPSRSRRARMAPRVVNGARRRAKP
jgi:hypothetical protein